MDPFIVELWATALASRKGYGALVGKGQVTMFVPINTAWMTGVPDPFSMEFLKGMFHRRDGLGGLVDKNPIIILSQKRPAALPGYSVFKSDANRYNSSARDHRAVNFVDRYVWNSERQEHDLYRIPGSYRGSLDREYFTETYGWNSRKQKHEKIYVMDKTSKKSVKV